MDEGNFFPEIILFAYIFVEIVSNKGKKYFSGGLTEACKVLMTVLCEKENALLRA